MNPMTSGNARRPGSLAPTPGFIVADERTQLHYRDWGKGRPILFLASWSMPSESWSYQMLPLVEQGFRCIAFDRRGHGRSSDPGRGYDFDTLADDVAAVIEALELDDITIVTHSMAGGEAIRYLTRHGRARIRDLVLVSPMTPLLTRREDYPEGLDPALFENVRRQQFMKDFPQWLADNVDPFFAPDTPPAMKDWARQLCLGASLQACVELNKAIVEADFRAELKAIDLPALIVHGNKDASAPFDLCAAATAKLMPKARLVVYGDAPHGLFLTHRDLLNADIASFVRDEALAA